MYLQQFHIPGLSHCSYVVGGRRAGIVVDPARDIERYIAAAASYNLPITAVVETHLHADFVSGHMDLARATGATVYVAQEAHCRFPCVGLADGQEVEIDTLRLRLLETPGHTPEGATFVVSDLDRGPEPALAFTGDTLLVGDVGRPDLFPDLKHELAAKLYHALRKIEALGDHLEVYPAHGRGSLCGRALSAKLSTTIGTERRLNYALRIGSVAEFASSLLIDMPEAPDHFSRCSEINRQGPQLVDELPQLRPLRPAEFAALVAQGHLVVDARDQIAFAGAHVPGAYCLSLKGNYAVFSGWVLPPDRPLLLVVESQADLEPALTGLRSVGLDGAVGYLEGGMTSWANAGLQAGHVESIAVPELKRRMERGGLLLIDTRLRSEWDAGHISGAIHAPAPDVRHRYSEWSPERPTAVICSTGNRSILAASLLRRLGFAHVINVIGGVTAWVAAGYPLVRD